MDFSCSGNDCINQFASPLKETTMNIHPKKKINRRFTKEEDNELRKYVKLYGKDNWRFIASCMKNRNARQCRERWCQYLSPNSNLNPWTKEEEQKLKKLAKVYNKDWTKIINYFKGRALSQLRNKYKTLERRDNKIIKEDKRKCRKKTPNRTVKFTLQSPISKSPEEPIDSSDYLFDSFIDELEYDFAFY